LVSASSLPVRPSRLKMLKTAKSQGFAMLIDGSEKSDTPKTVLDLRSSSF